VLNDGGVGKICDFQPILEFMHWIWRARRHLPSSLNETSMCA